MGTITFMHYFEQFIAFAARAYAIGGELISITAILFCLNFLASLVERTYNAGAAVGKFYFAYLHKPLIVIARQLLAAAKWLGLRALVFVLGLTVLAERAYQAWINRAETMQQFNNYRNQLGQLFTYQSPVAMLATAD